MTNDTIFKAFINVTTLMESELLPVKVDLKIGLNFDDVNPYHQAIALERIRFTINKLFQNSIFASRTNPVINQLKELTKTPIIECWDEPWDQFIALLIYYKLSAILESKGFVDFINVSGDTINNDLEFTYYSEMLNTELTDIDSDWIKKQQLKSLWYHRPDTTLNEDEDSGGLTWQMLGLLWDKNPPDPADTKLKTNNVSKFKPRIIK